MITTWQDLDHCHLAAASDFPGTEECVRNSGVPATTLRLTYGVAPFLARDVTTAMTAGELAAPAADAALSAAALSDLAEAAANVLAGTGHEGRAYDLSGPDTITWDDLASLASELAGKEIGYRAVSEDEFRALVLATGFPEAVLGNLLDLYAEVRSGWASQPTADLSTLLGRPATPSREAVRQAMYP